MNWKQNSSNCENTWTQTLVSKGRFCFPFAGPFAIPTPRGISSGPDPSGLPFLWLPFPLLPPTEEPGWWVLRAYNNCRLNPKYLSAFVLSTSVKVLFQKLFYLTEKLRWSKILTVCHSIIYKFSTSAFQHDKQNFMQNTQKIKFEMWFEK